MSFIKRDIPVENKELRKWRSQIMMAQSSLHYNALASDCSFRYCWDILWGPLLNLCTAVTRQLRGKYAEFSDTELK